MVIPTGTVVNGLYVYPKQFTHMLGVPSVSQVNHIGALHCCTGLFCTANPGIIGTSCGTFGGTAWSSLEASSSIVGCTFGVGATAPRVFCGTVDGNAC